MFYWFYSLTQLGEYITIFIQFFFSGKSHFLNVPKIKIRPFHAHHRVRISHALVLKDNDWKNMARAKEEEENRLKIALHPTYRNIKFLRSDIAVWKSYNWCDVGWVYRMRVDDDDDDDRHCEEKFVHTGMIFIISQSVLRHSLFRLSRDIRGSSEHYLIES